MADYAPKPILVEIGNGIHSIWIVMVVYHVSGCAAELNYLSKYLPHSCTHKYLRRYNM